MNMKARKILTVLDCMSVYVRFYTYIFRRVHWNMCFFKSVMASTRTSLFVCLLFFQKKQKRSAFISCGCLALGLCLCSVLMNVLSRESVNFSKINPSFISYNRRYKWWSPSLIPIHTPRLERVGEIYLFIYFQALISYCQARFFCRLRLPMTTAFVFLNF